MTTLFRSGPSSGTFTKVVCGLKPTGYPTVPSPTSVVKIKHWRNLEEPLTSYTMQKRMQFNEGGLMSPGVRAIKGINVSSQIRSVHTDVQFPNLESYRRESTKDVTRPARETEDVRRSFTHVITYGAGGLLSMFVVKETVQGIVLYKWMNAEQRALASIEINYGLIPEGQSMTYEWRGKPVFVRHRTAEEIAREKEVVVSELRDPQHDDDRVQRDEWSILIGVCTHLGCVPIAGAGDFGGYFCPCHGSHYDASGRIRKGPAPLNLEIPKYRFVDDQIMVVGE